MLVLVAGPYRSGTEDDPVLTQANVNAMLDASLTLFRAGHLPVMGEWFALPLVERAGSKHIGDSVFNEIFHPIARRLVPECDACLRIGGPSTGADEMVSLASKHGKIIFYSLAKAITLLHISFTHQLCLQLMRHGIFYSDNSRKPQPRRNISDNVPDLSDVR